MIRVFNSTGRIFLSRNRLIMSERLGRNKIGKLYTQSAFRSMQLVENGPNDLWRDANLDRCLVCRLVWANIEISTNQSQNLVA